MKLFERVREIASRLATSQTSLANTLGLKQATFQGYLKESREDNLWPLLPKILECYQQVNREWLYFGEGEMLKSESSTTNLPACCPQPTQTIPVLGLASCGVDGWEQPMQIAASTTIPIISATTVAVIASGDSMLPAGIASGHICLCDPEQTAIPGDAVLVKRRDGLATIKLFLGEGEHGPDWVRFKGWLSAAGNNHRKEFYIDMRAGDVEMMAPVIYVRRRI